MEKIMKYRYCRWIALFTGASAGLCPEFMNAIYADSRYGLIREVHCGPLSGEKGQNDPSGSV